MIPFRLLAFSLLGSMTILAIGCAGKTGTVQTQGLSDAKPVENKPAENKPADPAPDAPKPPQ